MNKMEFKNLVSIPSMFLLFSSIFSENESIDSNLDSKVVKAKLKANNFYESDNNW